MSNDGVLLKKLIPLYFQFLLRLELHELIFITL